MAFHWPELLFFQTIRQRKKTTEDVTDKEDESSAINKCAKVDDETVRRIKCFDYYELEWRIQPQNSFTTINKQFSHKWTFCHVLPQSIWLCYNTKEGIWQNKGAIFKVFQSHLIALGVRQTEYGNLDIHTSIHGVQLNFNQIYRHCSQNLFQHKFDTFMMLLCLFRSLKSQVPILLWTNKKAKSFFCVPHNKESYKGLEQHGQMYFWVNCPIYFRFFFFDIWMESL